VPLRFSLPLALAATLGVAVAAPARPVARAAALTGCHLSESEKQHLGVSNGYVTSLKVHGTSCANGKTVVRAFQACRRAHGGPRARCPYSTAVAGYHCTEARDGIKTQFTSRVVCASGSRRVVHTYTQFTT